MKPFKSFFIESELKPKILEKEIAEKHNVSLEEVKKRLKQGIKIEKEHTSSDSVAEQIASHHIFELLDYYDRLKKVEEKS